MLKHVQISPHRNRSDSLSLRSSTSCASSLCGSPEPPNDSIRTPSRASSYCSLNETIPQTTIRVFTGCLRLDIEYKTLGIQWDTTSKDVVAQLLRRCKMRQRDPRLFYLSMEVTVRKAGVRTVLVLDDEARPAILQACHPKGDSRFCLQVKPGGLIRVHTSALQPTSLYKSLVISEETTSDELLILLLLCCNSSEPVEQFSLYEVCPSQEYQRKLHPDDLPLRAQQQRIQKGEKCSFIIRKNPHYPRRRQLLPPIIETKLQITSEADQSQQGEQLTNDLYSKHNTASFNVHANIYRCMNVYASESPQICKMCRNSFRSCEFCNKNVTEKLGTGLTRITTVDDLPSTTAATNNSINLIKTTTYNPVYNIREIRTVCNSFSSLGIDKKILDVERSGHKAITIPTSSTIINSQSTITSTPNILEEAVNNNPAKGFGSYVYL